MNAKEVRELGYQACHPEILYKDIKNYIWSQAKAGFDRCRFRYNRLYLEKNIQEIKEDLIIHQFEVDIEPVICLSDQDGYLCIRW